jgi:hypothetical protein
MLTVALAASQIPGVVVRRKPKSRPMNLFRKEIRAIARLPEHILIVLITAAFCLYLINGEALQVDAFRAVLGILSVLSLTAPMNLFGLDHPSGLDRYALMPVTGSHIIWTKNLAFFAIVAIERAPIFALAAWRLGLGESLYGVIDAVSMVLATAAWGNVVSVRHPSPPDSEPLILDQLLSFAAAVLPAAATIAILRASGPTAPISMLAMLAVSAGLYTVSLRFAGPYFTRNFEEIRTH